MCAFQSLTGSKGHKAQRWGIIQSQNFEVNIALLFLTHPPQGVP